MSKKANNDNRANQFNPNSPTYQKGLDNRANQLNPNNSKTKSEGNRKS